MEKERKKANSITKFKQLHKTGVLFYILHFRGKKWLLASGKQQGQKLNLKINKKEKKRGEKIIIRILTVPVYFMT